MCQVGERLQKFNPWFELWLLKLYYDVKSIVIKYMISILDIGEFLKMYKYK